MSGIVYGNMSRAALDAAYNNQAAHPNFAEQTAIWRVQSERVRETYRPLMNLRYGKSARAVLDFYPSRGTGGPLLIFVHGGYWQGGSKESVGFLARGPLASGFSVALLDYAVAPEASLGEMVDEVCQALHWLDSQASRLKFDARRIVLAGHSAGAHLMCNLLDELPILGGVAISGIYDLEPIRHSYLNERLGLNEQDVRQFSPMLMPRSSAAPLLVTVGANELDELIRQSRDFSHAWNTPLLEVAGREHFTILDELADQEGQLCLAICEMAS